MTKFNYFYWLLLVSVHIHPPGTARTPYIDARNRRPVGRACGGGGRTAPPKQKKKIGRTSMKMYRMSMLVSLCVKFFMKTLFHFSIVWVNKIICCVIKQQTNPSNNFCQFLLIRVHRWFKQSLQLYVWLRKQYKKRLNIIEHVGKEIDLTQTQRKFSQQT